MVEIIEMQQDDISIFIVFGLHGPLGGLILW